MTRRIAVLLVALLGLGALAPLAPAAPAAAAPAKTFTTTYAFGPDTDPGDGVCAVAGGGCSFQAAMEEAVALRKGTIIARGPGGYTGSIRGAITVTGIATGDRQYLSMEQVTVEKGATFTVRRVYLDGWMTVRGRVNVDRAGLMGMRRFKVDPSGVATITSSLVATSRDSAALTNNGRLSLVYTTVTSGAAPRMIQTGSTGTTTLQATNLIGKKGVGQACAGTKPVSQGYNLSYDGTCRLNHPTDLGIYVPLPNELGPEGTVRVDAVPAGEAGCGTTVTTDFGGAVRPFDGDGDGTTACDIGYRELGSRPA